MGGTALESSKAKIKNYGQEDYGNESEIDEISDKMKALDLDHKKPYNIVKKPKISSKTELNNDERII